MSRLVSIVADLSWFMLSSRHSFVSGVSNGKAFVLFASQTEANHAMERPAGNSHGLTVEKARGGRMRTDTNLVATVADVDTAQLSHQFQNTVPPFGVRFGDGLMR